MAAIHNFRLGAWQRQFLTELFQVVIRMRGRVNFTNMARYSAFREQTFRRHFRKAFRWIALNLTMLRLRRHPREPLIGVFDCTFVPKSGTESYGLGRFFSSAAGRPERGQEVSILGVVATESREAFGIDATQTPASLSGSDSSAEHSLAEHSLAEHSSAGYSSVDFYIEQIQDLQGPLAEMGVSYWVGDGFYAKRKVFRAVTEMDGDLVTRLRSDANLRYLYTGPRKQGPGAPKLYDGKINFDCPDQIESRFEEVGRLPDRAHVEVWTTVANSPHFKRSLRIVLLRNSCTDRSLLLCSTDTEQAAEEVVRYYRLRYQIEFVIRDAKQHTGLTHCQARSQEKIDFHLNMSIAGVNLLRLMAGKAGCSLRTYRRMAYNRFLTGRLFSELGLSGEWSLSDREVQPVLETGQMAS
jgi:Transposase DDE domain.